MKGEMNTFLVWWDLSKLFIEILILSKVGTLIADDILDFP